MSKVILVLVVMFAATSIGAEETWFTGEVRWGDVKFPDGGTTHLKLRGNLEVGWPVTFPFRVNVDGPQSLIFLAKHPLLYEPVVIAIAGGIRTFYTISPKVDPVIEVSLFRYQHLLVIHDFYFRSSELLETYTVIRLTSGKMGIQTDFVNLIDFDYRDIRIGPIYQEGRAMLWGGLRADSDEDANLFASIFINIFP